MVKYEWQGLGAFSLRLKQTRLWSLIDEDFKTQFSMKSLFVINTMSIMDLEVLVTLVGDSTSWVRLKVEQNSAKNDVNHNHPYITTAAQPIHCQVMKLCT